MAGMAGRDRRPRLSGTLRRRGGTISDRKVADSKLQDQSRATLPSVGAHSSARPDGTKNGPRRGRWLDGGEPADGRCMGDVEEGIP